MVTAVRSIAVRWTAVRWTAVRLAALTTIATTASASMLLLSANTVHAQETAKGAPLGVPFAVSVHTLSGDSVRIGVGSPTTIVAVFATWCRPCRDEVPALNMLQRDFASRGVRVVALSMDEGSSTHLSEWLKHYGAKYPVTRDSVGLAHKLGVTSIPAVYVVNNAGQIDWMLHGALLSSLPELRARLKQLPIESQSQNR